MGPSRVDSDYISHLSSKIPSWLARLIFVAATTSKDDEHHKSSHCDFSSSENQNRLLQEAHQLLKCREKQGPAAMRSVVETTLTPKTSLRSRWSAGRKGSDASAEKPPLNNYRARNAISVAYDSTTQIHFETLVEEMNVARRVIGKAIENLEESVSNRRASESLKQDQLIDDEPVEDVDTNDRRDSLDREFMLARIRRGRRGSPTTTASRSSTINSENVGGPEHEKIQKLGSMDKCLQHAQDTCNTAAYQMLRDGQCSWETDAICDQLKEIWKAVKEEGGEAEADDKKISSSRQFRTGALGSNQEASQDQETHQITPPRSVRSSSFDAPKFHKWHVQILSDEETDSNHHNLHHSSPMHIT